MAFEQPQRNSDPPKERNLRARTTTPHSAGNSSCDSGFRMTADATSTLGDQVARVGKTRNRALSTPPAACTAPAYCYSPLVKGHIRLLRLMPHADKNCPYTVRHLRMSSVGLGWWYSFIQCSVLCVGYSENSHPIPIGESHLPVTVNLQAALSRLRDRFMERIIWVDAICVNQEDLKERAHQVQLMVSKFAKASSVYVWLGEAENDSTWVSRGGPH
ncbi:heterokaryon incompatibility protein-domain-containing protein [Xylaria acuta]|nr:heterokaryon incompatibility protein-domain-containing protein [Xylaria acuta]